MKRKIVKQGSSTMTISLPASWIKKFELKEGDEIDISENGNVLKIATDKTKGEGLTKTINTKDEGYFAKNDLTHYYMVGYDELTINFHKQEILEDMKKRVPECIGYEIMNQSEKSITIKSISSIMENEFDNILKKIFFIQKEMGNDLYDALKNKEFERLNQIRELEHINNKFCVFLLRVLSKKGYKKYNRSLQAYDMIQNMERVADEYKYICDDYIEHKKAITPKALELLKQANEYYELFLEMFLKENEQNKSEMHFKYKEIKSEVQKLLQKGTEVILCYHIKKAIEKINNAKGSYLALIID